MRRGNRFLEAGASCVFVPAVTDEQTIAALTKEIRGPMNVLASPASSPVARLAEIGVARVSVGGAAMGHALLHLRTAAAEVFQQGTFGFAADGIAHAQLNALFVPNV